MITRFVIQDGLPAPVEMATVLPGPGKRRAQQSYIYCLKYLNTTPELVGCVMTWDVHGGRLTYQIAVERTPKGELCCHCTCADAVFRAELEGRSCKHVEGFLTWSRGLNPGRELGRAG